MSYNDFIQLENITYKENLDEIYKRDKCEGKTSPVEGDFIPSNEPIKILEIIPSYYYTLLN